MANRKLGCLSIFLFVALCASVFINFVLAVATLYVLVNIAIDILYGIVDVRVRLAG